MFPKDIIQRLNDEYPKIQKGGKIYCKRIKEIKETLEGIKIIYYNRYLLIVDMLAYFIYLTVTIHGRKNGNITKWVRIYIEDYIEINPNSLASKVRRYNTGEDLTSQAKLAKELCEQKNSILLKFFIDDYFKYGRCNES